MNKDSRSRTLGLSLSLFAAVGLALLLLLTAGPASADPPEVFAQWDFESGTTAPSVDLAGNAVASAGSGLGVEDFAGGNGSIYSWRFDGWTTGDRDVADYFQFKVDLSKYAHITLSFAVKRSNDGPTDLDVRYNTDCSAADTQAIPGALTIADNSGWRTHSFDLGSKTAVDQAIRGQPEVCFRIYGFDSEDEDNTWQIDDVTFHAAELNALLISKTAPVTVPPNEVFTYTLYITNNTTISTTGTTFTDTVPANATYVPGSASDGGTLVDDSVISWTIPGTFTAGLAISRTFQVTAGAYGVSIVNNDYAVAAANWPTPTVGDAVTTTVVAPVLGVDKTGPDYAAIGKPMVYTITLSNSGLATAANVTVTDRFPTGTTYLEDNSGVIPTNPSPGAYVWSMGDLLSDTIHAINVTVTVNSSVTAGTVLTNEVEVSTESAGDLPDDNIAWWETTALKEVDLVTYSTKAVEPEGDVRSGDYMTYTITLSNTGALDAAVTLTDTLPDGLLLVQGLNGGGLTWSGTVTAGEEVVLTLVAQADPDLAAISTVSNVVTIDDGLNTAFDIHSPETTIIVPGPTITKEVTPEADVPLGSYVTYTLTLGNDDDATVGGVTLSDTLPSQVTFGGWVQQSGAVEAMNSITWTGGITPEEQVLMIFTATVGTDPGLYGQTITNTGTISHTTGERFAEASFAIIGPPALPIAKTVAVPRDPVYPGDPITYTITVANNTEEDALGVVVADSLPVGVLGEDLAWTGPISAGEQVEFVIQATVTTSSAFLGETLTNTAYYSYTGDVASAEAAFTIVDAWRTYLPWVKRSQ